jgi:hypothetical protein
MPVACSQGQGKISERARNHVCLNFCFFNTFFVFSRLIFKSLLNLYFIRDDISILISEFCPPDFLAETRPD